jgi:galactose oxidase-like protein
MRSRRGAVAACVALLLVGLLGLVPTGAQANSVVGAWLSPFSEGRTFDLAAPANEVESDQFPPAVSIAVLPDGNVVYWTGLDDTENLDGPLGASGGPPNQESRSRALNLSGYFSSGSTSASAIPISSWSTPSPESGGGGDMFCADLRLLASGKVLVAGGTLWTNEDQATTDGTPAEGLGRTELWGRKDTRLYDPRTNSWSQSGNMDQGRWYPAVITLGNGRLFVAGGVGRLIYNSSALPGSSPTPSGELAPINVRESEYYDTTTGQWTVNTNDASKLSLPLFPRLHLLPNGKVLFTTNGQVWGPFGEDVPDQLNWDSFKLFNPATNAWEDGGRGGLGARNGAVDVMLRLEPPYDTAKVLMAGGTLGSSPGSWFSNNLTEIVSWSTTGPTATAPTRTMAGNLNNLRWYSSGVLLPSGEVVATSGGDVDEVIFPGIEHAVRQAEQFDPATGEWTALASGARDRTYHNTAVLLKDGTILVGGHSPITAGYGQDQSNVPTFASNMKDPSFEILKPPYLFRGSRPSITTISSSTVTRGGTVNVTTSDAANSTLEVVLSRLPTTTHTTDADARTVHVTHKDNGNGTITVAIPSNANVLPGGYYYLFLMKNNGQGLTPSVAEIIKVNV